MVYSEGIWSFHQPSNNAPTGWEWVEEVERGAGPMAGIKDWKGDLLPLKGFIKHTVTYDLEKGRASYKIEGGGTGGSVKGFKVARDKVLIE